MDLLVGDLFCNVNATNPRSVFTYRLPHNLSQCWCSK